MANLFSTYNMKMQPTLIFFFYPNTGNALFFVKEQFHANIMLQVHLKQKLILSEGKLMLSLR
jgi:hypothetical protein